MSTGPEVPEVSGDVTTITTAATVATTKVDTIKVDTIKVDTTKVDTIRADTTRVSSSNSKLLQLFHPNHFRFDWIRFD